MKSMDKIVWLASWFPNKEEPLNGDFIKRHAEAVSLYKPVHVIHVKRRLKSNQKTIIENYQDQNFANLTYSIAFYSMPSFLGIEKFISYCYSLWLYHKMILQYKAKNGKPKVIHVHITLRAGWVALYHKIFYKTPYFVTEQYSGYMPEAKPYKPGFSFWRSIALRTILNHSSCFLPVSHALGQSFLQQFPIRPLRPVYNVVNMKIFKPIDKKQPNSNVPVFIHISTLTAQKNPEDMLKSFHFLKHQYHQKFLLQIVGPSRPDLKKMVHDLVLDDMVLWMAETTQQALFTWMQQADALVLYSRFETFGCVNIEAIASGLPVVVSDIPVFREYLQEGINAFFAETENPEKLAYTLHTFIEKRPFDNISIAATAHHFSYEKLGATIMEVYEEFM